MRTACLRQRAERSLQDPGEGDDDADSHHRRGQWRPTQRGRSELLLRLERQG